MSSMTNLHNRATYDFVSSLGCEQIATEPTHIDGGVLTEVPDAVGVRFGSPVGIVFMDVVLDQPIL